MAGVLVAISLLNVGNHPLIPDLPFQDSDDVMRMLQVLAWRDGGGWYDLTQYRINPPAGLAMHWARPPDLPLLGTLVLSELWLGRADAIRFTATLVPALLALAYFAAFVWAAQPLTGRAASPQAGLIALTASLPLLVFNAGRIDHHGWQLILALMMAGALLRLAAGGAGARATPGGGIQRRPRPLDRRRGHSALRPDHRGPRCPLVAGRALGG